MGVAVATFGGEGVLTSSKKEPSPTVVGVLGEASRFVGQRPFKAKTHLGKFLDPVRLRLAIDVVKPRLAGMRIRHHKVAPAVREGLEKVAQVSFFHVFDELAAPDEIKTFV